MPIIQNVTRTGAKLGEITFEITGLTPGDTYEITAQEIIDALGSNLSDPLLIPLPIRQPPPTDLSLSSPGYNQATISWTQAQDIDISNGAPVIKYTIYYTDLSSNISSSLDVSASDTSYNFDSLIGGDYYEFYMTATNSLSESLATDSQIIFILPPPPPPIIQSVTSTIKNSVTINWTNEQTIGITVTGYNIYYYDSSDNSGNIVITDPNASSYIINNLIGGNTYTFYMTTTNTNDESFSSNMVDVNVLQEQMPPNNVTVVSTTINSAIVNWTSAKTVNSGPITKYTIYYTDDPSNNIPNSIDVSANYTSYIFNNTLDGGKTYTFYVTATNDYNESLASNPSNQVLILALQPPPTDVSGISLHPNQATITWTSALTINSFQVTKYTIYYYLSSSPSIVSQQDISANNTSATIYGLVNSSDIDNTYIFYMTASNSYSNSINTVNTSVILPQLQPSPTITLASSNFLSQASIIWSTPSTVRGLPILYYNIYYYDTYNPTNTFTQRVEIGNIMRTFNNLPGNSYTFSMTATNSYGESLRSTPLILPLLVPQPPPASVSITSYTNNIYVNWTEAPSVGTGPVLKYTIYYYATDNSSNVINIDVSANIRTYTIGSLATNKTYNVFMTATNINNQSERTYSTPSSITLYTQQPAPTNIRVAGNNFNSATVTWNSATTVSGSGPVTKYTIYYYTMDSSNNPTSQDVSNNLNSFTLTNLIGGARYYFKMTASNNYNSSVLTNSIPSSLLISQQQQPQPTNVDVSFSILNQVTVSWTPALTVDRGDPITKYTIYYFTSDNSSNITSIDVSSNITSRTIYGLTSGKIYNFNMTASNATSESSHTSNIIVVNQFEPVKPLIVSVVSSALNKITLSWNAPIQIQGHPITKYTIYYYDMDNSSNVINIDVSANYTSYELTSGLINGKTYTIYMTSTNDISESLPTIDYNLLNIFQLSPPTNIIAISSRINKAYIYWTRPEFIPGTTLTKYKIYYYKTYDSATIFSQDISVNNTQYEFDLSGGQTYSFYMTAWYGVSETIQSNTSVVTVLLTLPQPISNICFPEKTPIRTDQGLIHIDKINPELNTIHKKKIVAITKTITQDKFLISFEKDSLGTNIPCNKTIITPNHKILYDGKMIKAKNFVDKLKGVKNVPYNGEVLYNVLLEDLDKMMVNNIIAETLDPKNPIAEFYTKFNLDKLDDYNKLRLINHFNEIVIKNKVYSSPKK
uniref:Fibronectin type-III domain-containing protein n=1 Tax=viral metagenome TaxID=1070528 RepID=A0A6C0IF63_9ZZZZ